MKHSFSYQSRLPESGTTIFTIMSKMATEFNAINLGQGFPDYDCDPKLIKLVKKYLDQGKNQYAPMPGVPELRKTVSEKIKRIYSTEIDPDAQICITSGATQALQTAIIAFIQKNDEVIIFEPAFDCYIPQIQIAGGIPKPYSMTLPDFRVDWEKVNNMVTDRTRMIIINTPHNPTGTILKKEDLIALENIVRDKNILVLSDEVYEHLIFDSEEHQSVLRYPNLFQQSLAVFSFGKTLHATGWKLGYVVGPESFISEFKRLHQWNVFCSNSFLQYAIAEYMEDPSSYEYLPTFFEKKRDLMIEKFKTSPFNVIKSEGTYFQLYDYSHVSDSNDADFAIELVRNAGVATIPLSPFYTSPPKDRVLRFCFAKKDETIESAGEKLRSL